RVFGPLLSSLASPAMVWYPTLGIALLGGEVDDAQAASRAVSDARAGLVERGGSLVLEAAPEDVRANVDVWGPPPASFALMKRMKDRFDPDRRLSPGRFVGGI